MITAQRMAAVDENAAALGVPRKQLMESSGNAVARAVGEETEPGSRVVIVAGRGNNGGDAFVTARFLDDRDVTVYLLGRRETISTDIARENWEALQRADADAHELRDSTAVEAAATGELTGDDMVVDAMVGTGVTGALREPMATAAEAINGSDAPVLSVDVPSGVDADTGERAGVAVEADRVVTFHDQKPGLTERDATVTVADIGIPEAAEQFVERGDLLLLGRNPTSHKGDNGEVLVVGGGPYTGAPALSAQAALRAGADLVRVACPEYVAREVQGYSEDLIVRGFESDRLSTENPETMSTIQELAADHDTVVFGPGLGTAEDTLAAVREFLADFDGRAVIDADALQVVPEVDTDATLVCTPHAGELRAMGGPGVPEDDWRARADALEDFAADIGHTLLLKGKDDVISDGETTRIGRTGNAGMTVGGTGDVLAGITGALLAVQEPVDAAGIAAFVNGRAGDVVAEERGVGLMATDLLDAIPGAMALE
jgi:NAD(P)H-hydrate epimerase